MLTALLLVSATALEKVSVVRQEAMVENARAAVTVREGGTIEALQQEQEGMQPKGEGWTNCAANAPEWQTHNTMNFCLGAMHSYVEIPMCGGAPAAMSPSYEGLDPSNAANRTELLARTRFRRREQVDAIAENLACFCDSGVQRPHIAYGRVDWNIPGAMDALSVSTIRFQNQGAAKIEPCVSGPLKSGGYSVPDTRLQTIPMHPICAWGIVRDLQSRYSTGQRWSGMSSNATSGAVWSVTGGVLQAASRSTFKTLGTSIVAVAKAKKGERLFDLSVAAANSLDWDGMLSLDCGTARPSKTILESKCIGKVCWNFVHDFHDLWCTLWQTDALTKGVTPTTKRGCDLTSGECCSAIAEDHSAWLTAEGSGGAAPRDLNQLRADRYRRLVKAELETSELDIHDRLKHEIFDLFTEIQARVIEYRKKEKQMSAALNKSLNAPKEEAAEQEKQMLSLQSEMMALNVLADEVDIADKNDVSSYLF